jgi:hypothetical protein
MEESRDVVGSIVRERGVLVPRGRNNGWCLKFQLDWNKYALKLRPPKTINASIEYRER